MLSIKTKMRHPSPDVAEGLALGVVRLKKTARAC
jgi:hypothetical protein